MTDAFDRIEWEYASKGQRSAPLGSYYRPAGRYTLTKPWGLPDPLPAGTSLYLTAEQATRMRDSIKPEGR